MSVSERVLFFVLGVALSVAGHMTHDLTDAPDFLWSALLVGAGAAYHIALERRHK